MVLSQIGLEENGQFVVRLGRNDIVEDELVNTINSFMSTWTRDVAGHRAFLPSNLNDCLSFVKSTKSWHLKVLGIYSCTPLRVDKNRNQETIESKEQKMLFELLLFVLEKSNVTIFGIQLGKLQWNPPAPYFKFKIEKFPFLDKGKETTSLGELGANYIPLKDVREKLQGGNLEVGLVKITLSRLPENIRALSFANSFDIEGSTITMKFPRSVLIFSSLRFYQKCQSAVYLFENS